jgi:hypothetical protein
MYSASQFRTNGRDLMSWLRFVTTSMRACGVLVAILAILGLQLMAPAALASCGPVSCNLPCAGCVLVSSVRFNSCGLGCSYEVREYYCTTQPIGYFYCSGCFCNI